MPIRSYFLFFLGFFIAFLFSFYFLTLRSFQQNPLSPKREIPILTTGKPELCLLCHREKIPERAHSVEILGCSSCHLGNPLTSDKIQAHKGMIKNPSDLRVIERTCGQANCHPGDGKKVKNSLMATNHGILLRLIQVFKEDFLLKDFPNLKVADLYDSKASLEKSYALDYFKKLCGSCHLYLEKEKFKNFLAEKGGGCSACHLSRSKEDLKKKKFHPKLTKFVELEKCIQCHNRSGRIGLTYQGLYETQQGGIYDLLWKDGRKLKKISPDIHYTKGLHCIDCHTREEIMGDGTFYKNIESALEITCETCHKEKGKTKKLRKLSQIWVKNNKVFQKLKFKEKILEIKSPSDWCQRSYHKRLSCSACHSHYVPQCMGCHVRFDPKETHLDKIKAVETKGLWEEHESYRTFEDPPLAIKGDKIVPVTPG